MTKRHKGLLASKLKLLIAQNAEQTKHERRSHSLCFVGQLVSFIDSG